MNKIYKLKYDRRRQQLVAVSELTTGAGKEATGQVCGLSDISSFRKLLGTLTPLAFLTGLIVSLLPGMALANPSLPTGGQIVAGQGSISTSGNQMTVNQNTQGMVTNWNSFDIGKNHTVQFVQPGSSAVALNRVTGGHESQILGTLKANGQVMLINPAGVMFGKGAKVNTAGLVASTKNISNEDFMAGRYTFSGGSQPGAEIVNQGSLTTTKGGYIVLAADRVRNQGEIRTPGGRVVLAAADRVTLQLDNTGLTAVSVNGSVVNALAENRGLISATNGQVYLTARGKDMLLNTVVNNSGTVEAKGLSERGGEIVLDGGDSGVVSQSGMLLADSDSGRGGKITLEGQNIHLAGGSLISATGETGGGEVYVGGGWQGKDSSIRHASKVVMDKTAVIDVSAKARGQGGTAVLWSDDYTNFRGTILARGGLQGGDGGRVETSSHHNLQAFGDVDASAVKGNAGEWLLDPFDITVVSGSTDTDVNEGSGNDGIFTPDTGTSQVSNGTINNRLNSGTNVTIKTAKENSGSTQWGNITVNADISHTATNNVSLTLEADGNINITNHSITSTTGKLDVNLLGAGSHDGTITLNNATVSSNGGNITLGQLNAGSDGTTSGLAVSITNSTLNATSAGNISITANNGTTLDNGTLSGNEVSVSASSGTGDALVINNGSNLTAVGNLTVIGETSATGNKYGIHTWGNSQFTAGDTLNMTAEAAGGTDGAFNASNINVSAQNAVIKGTSGGANGTGVKMDGNVTNTREGGNLTITGTTTGSGAGSIGVNVLANLTTNGTGNLNITGKGAQGIGVNLTNKTLSGGNVTVTGTSGNSNGKGLDVSGTILNATNGNIVLTGCMTGRNGGFGAHIHGGSRFTAKDNITITGYAMDGTNGGLNLIGGTFNATSTVLSGTSQNNNLGAKVGGMITVSQGNLSLSGTANRVNSAPNVTGVVSDGTLSITVSSGALNVSGKVNDTGNNATNAGTTRGLSLVNTTLNATEVSLSGEVAGGRGGTGASLTNTTINATTGNAALNATVANGNALAVSGGNITAGKDISLTGTAKAGSGYGVSLTNGNMTASSGNISLTGNAGISLSGSNMTAGKDLTINNGDASLTVQNTTLNATAGNISLTGNAGISLSGSNMTAGKDLTINSDAGSLSLTNSDLNATAGNIGLNATVANGNALTVSGGNISAGKDISLTGTAKAGSGYGVSLTNGNMTASSGNISVNGTGYDSGSGALQVNGGNFSAQNTVLEGTAGRNNVGANLTGNINVTQGNLAVTGTVKRTNDGAYQGLTASNLNISVTGGTLSLAGCITNAAASGSKPVALTLTNANLSATDVSLSGTVESGGTGLSLTNTTINATTGNATLNATVANGNALVVSGGNITAGKDISLTGTAKAGSGYGVSLTNGNMTATAGNINVNGTGFDSNRGALNVNGGNFSAQNTVLEGTAGRNNKGTVLNGNINVTQGNLAVTGTVTQTANSLDNNQFTGLLASGNITVSQGSLNLTGHISGKSGSNAKAVNLTNLNISASNASITGVNERNGTGFILSNVNLTGDIEKGANTTFSSAGSDSSVTNVIGSGVLNATTTDVLMRAGIENDTQISASGMALGGSGDNWNQNYTSSKGGGWIFDGATVSKTGNISLQGVGFVNSSVTAGKDLTINNGADSLTVQNTTLNATTISLSGGSISLTGNSSVNAVNDITLNAPKGGVNINGQSNVNTVNISSASGNISIEGNGAGFNRDGVLISNALLNASQGGITVTGVADGADYRLRGGVKFTDSVNLTSQSNTINGTHQRGNAGRVNFAGVVINPGDYHFKGNTTINAESDDYAGLAFSSSVPRTYITFSDGNFVIDAKNNSTAFNSIGGISIDNWEGTQAKIIITTLNGTLNISGQARNREGINSVSSSFSINPNDGSGYHGYVFKGDGDVNVKGVSDSSNGVDMRFFDNTGVTGNFTITGESNTGNGVAVPKFGEISLVNTTITGSSKSGAGILMNASDKQIKKIDLNGNTLTGTSVSGAGIKINGNNVSIANGSLNGTSQGNGAGVELTGGNNYTVSHATVTGQSAGGNAVGVNGNLTLNDSTLSGNTVNGSGVSVNGNVNATNTTISGGATGSGNGVSLGGNASITDGTVTGSAVDGNGVSVSGNVNTTNTTVTGDATGSGTGVDLAGNVTGGTVNGNATDGTGVNVSGNSTLTDVTVNGNTTSGTGVDVNANLTNQGSTTVNGNATGSGTGVDLAGNVTGGT
ncbi:filamentous hemagglutinin N-terminal domain-containing protein, partial [Salmonella enterica subsp. enterica serovar Tennessee]|nr:filamentous hemagglutinin N-terminal domain-containing protein [Salmonella enterica subsp. enterica serovar Tennessee]ECH7616255.1 filamentous hemagglutinin N-terminal domain-containing protein [Salmonella enterica subsp. enterica serovar Tennessee]EHS5298867.1 filamentous hemagglutinin N-terminal domain-containing protein [Salmonella enterica subsp. enterica serovar Tennessee]EID1999770.1 filamentous hemagglutinin N-terminal domain-containing protein [Salmonella enterica subsp. enterica sero